MEAEFQTFKPILKIGDKMHFSFRLPKNIRDTLNEQLVVDRGIEVFVKISTTSDPADTLSSDVFKTDTTIFHVFHKYFETKNIVESSIDAYTFKGEFINGFWQVETQYITKKAGTYWASIFFTKIDSSMADQEDGVCMVGETQTFGATLVWKQSENNRIDILFNDKKEKYPEYYGFIVEE